MSYSLILMNKTTSVNENLWKTGNVIVEIFAELNIMPFALINMLCKQATRNNFKPLITVTNRSK